MTVFDLQLLLEYWGDNPPANEILAAVHLKRVPRLKKAPRNNLPSDQLRQQKWIKDLEASLAGIKTAT
jgi:hypothetical protein